MKRKHTKQDDDYGYIRGYYMRKMVKQWMVSLYLINTTVSAAIVFSVAILVDWVIQDVFWILLSSNGSQMGLDALVDGARVLLVLIGLIGMIAHTFYSLYGTIRAEQAFAKGI